MKTLDQEQQNLLGLALVKSCLDYGSDAQKTFQEVLTEDVFPNEASEEFEKMLCNTLVELNEQGYISGKIELVYEKETDPDTFEETVLNTLNTPMCTFEDISITPKGNLLLSGDGFKKAGKDFLEKAKPVIKCIALVTLQAMVETAIAAGLRAAGIKV